MTLSRQLMLSGIAILLFLFVGVLSYMFRNTEAFLSQQLSSHSQDAATALGLTLTTTMKQNDLVTANRVIDAVWDSGYYSMIQVLSSDGKPLVERSAAIKVYDVPNWFIKLIPLNKQREEALIMDGWNRVGKVIVESNPGFAYEQIWLTCVGSFKWLLMTTVLAIILGGILINIILRPLKAITQQAFEICNQQFSIQKTLPWTIDLRQVVQAMNNMSSRLKKMFEEQAEISERLREQAYKDPITQLANRRYFDLQLDSILKDTENGMDSVLLLIEISQFKEFNEKFGYQEGDKLLINTAKAIKETCQGQENAIVTHAKGASFFVVFPGATKEVGESVADKICVKFREFSSEKLVSISNVGHVGVSVFKPGDARREVISRVDMALRAAQSMGENRWYSMEFKAHEVHPATEWASIFEKVLKENKVILHFQKTVFWINDYSQENEFYETLMRIYIDDKQLISAGVFVPMAEQLDLMSSLDKLVIENVVEKIIKSQKPIVYFVNISPSALDHTEFKQWVLEKYKHLGKQAAQLVIELPEQAVVSRIQKVRAFFMEISALGGKTSIDHYGKSFSSFSYLYNLKLHYLKIDGAFIRNVNVTEENQFFIRSLIDIAHSLDIFVIAESVETEEEFATLKQLKVDGLQGYYVGKPTEIDI